MIVASLSSVTAGPSSAGPPPAPARGSTGPDLFRFLGPITVEATPRGVSRIELGASGEFAFGNTREAAGYANRALDQLIEYAAGERRTFDVPLDLDALQGATPFRRKVLEALLRIPFGSTLTYGDIARTVKSPAPRAVGQAVGWNPLPIIVPCHRVLAANGRLGGYSGGINRKKRLLELEGIRFDGAEFGSRIESAS